MPGSAEDDAPEGSMPPLSRRRSRPFPRRPWAPGALRLACAGALLLSACAGGPPEAPEGAAAAPYGGALAVDPDPAAFGPTPPGCTRGVELVLSNAEADRSLAIRRVTATSSELAFAAGLPLAIPPGGEARVALLRTPGSPGPWSGTVRLWTDEADEPPYALEVSAAPADTSERPLDLVLVLDVSTSMEEIAALRAGIVALAERLGEAPGSDPGRVRLGLVTFDNGVVVHRDGRLLEPAALVEELDTQLVEGAWVPDPSLPRHLLNFDLPENLLDALYRASQELAYREDARRILLAATDATFLEPPEAFSDGTPALHSYTEVAEALQRRGLRLIALSSADARRGLATSYADHPPLTTLTGGAWLDLAAVTAGSPAPGDLLWRLVQGSTCEAEGPGAASP